MTLPYMRKNLERIRTEVYSSFNAIGGPTKLQQTYMIGMNLKDMFWLVDEMLRLINLVELQDKGAKVNQELHIGIVKLIKELDKKNMKILSTTHLKSEGGDTKDASS